MKKIILNLQYVEYIQQISDFGAVEQLMLTGIEVQKLLTGSSG